jgi:hypothetical protein
LTSSYDIANAAVFLTGDAASFITGHDLVVGDGLVPFAKSSWEEEIEFRAEIARPVESFQK